MPVQASVVPAIVSELTLLLKLMLFGAAGVEFVPEPDGLSVTVLVPLIVSEFCRI